MEERVLNAVDGYCSLDAADEVPYFESLDVLRCAYNSVVENCGMMEACFEQAKLVSNRLRGACFTFVRRRRRYDITALLYLVAVAEASRDGVQRGLRRAEILARARQIGVQCWDGGEEDPYGLVLAPLANQDRQLAELAPQGTRPKRMRLDRLIVACSPSDQELIRGKFEKLSAKLKWQKQKTQRLQSKLQVVTADRDNMLTPYRKDGGHLKTDGDYNLWRKRNFGHTSAGVLLQILRVEGTNEIVLRSERRGGAAHYLAGRQLVHQINCIHESATCRQFRAVVIRTDAFSSSTARTDSAKLAVTELRVGPQPMDDQGRRSRKLIADLQDVTVGNSQEFVSVILRQMRSLGVITWEDEFPASDFVVFAFVADDGPDVAGGIALIIESIADKPNVSVLRVTCCMHALQLCVKKAVQGMDACGGDRATDPKYSTQLMRGCNVWRSFGHHKLLRRAAVQRYNEEVASLHFNTAIGNVVRTRWGTFEGPERKLLRGHLGTTRALTEGEQDVPPMTRARSAPVLRRRGAPRKHQQGAGTDPLPIAAGTEPGDALGAEGSVIVDWAQVFADALRVDRCTQEECAPTLDIDGGNSSAVLRVRARKTVHDFRTSDLWVKMIVGHVSRAPYAHGLNSLQRFKANPDIGNGKGYLRWFSDLLTRMLGEFVSLLKHEHAEDDDWWGVAFKVLGSGGCGDAWPRAKVLSLIMTSVLGNCAELIRRFGDFGVADESRKRLPWSCFDLLGWAPDDVSADRSALAQRLLHTQPPRDGFSDKFLNWFRPELCACAEAGGGMVSNLAYECLEYLDGEVTGDVQAIESMNSVLRVITTRARHVNRDLVSARHVIMHSEPDLVDAAVYTDELRTEAQLVAKLNTSHERFTPLPISSAILLPRSRDVGVPLHALRSVVKLAQMFKKCFVLTNVIRVSMVWGVSGASRSSVSRPWYAASAHRHGVQGFLLEPGGDPSIYHVAGSVRALRRAYMTLLDVLGSVLCDAAPWPLPPGTICELTVGQVEWENLGVARVLSWGAVESVKLPFKFATAAGAQSAPAPAQGDAPVGQRGDDEDSDFDLERALLDIIGEEADSGAEVSDDFPEPVVCEGGNGSGASPEELADMIAAENPFLPEDLVARDASGQGECTDAGVDAGEEDNGAGAGDGSGGESDSDTSGSGSSGSNSSRSSTSSSAPEAPHAIGTDGGGKRGPGLGPINTWVDVKCARCGAEPFAQIKDFSGYGRMDMFICRVRLSDGTFPTKGAFHKRRLWKISGGKSKCRRWCMRWLESHRQCCD